MKIKKVKQPAARVIASALVTHDPGGLIAMGEDTDAYDTEALLLAKNLDSSDLNAVTQKITAFWRGRFGEGTLRSEVAKAIAADILLREAGRTADDDL